MHRLPQIFPILKGPFLIYWALTMSLTFGNSWRPPYLEELRPAGKSRAGGIQRLPPSCWSSTTFHSGIETILSKLFLKSLSHGCFPTQSCDGGHALCYLPSLAPQGCHLPLACSSPEANRLCSLQLACQSSKYGMFLEELVLQKAGVYHWKRNLISQLFFCILSA